MAKIIQKFSELKKLLSEDTNIRTGCLVDTSILFSASYDLDQFNTDAEQLFDTLVEEKIPIFTNVNIRTEFIELHRRATIPEALIDFLKDYRQSLDKEIVQKLTSLETQYNKKIKNGESFLLQDREIKKIRELFLQYQKDHRDPWRDFCLTYLGGRIQNIWDEMIKLFGINFISLRTTENHPMMESDVSWEKMVQLVEQFGIGSMDAMILNLFLCSKLKVLITADKDLIYAVGKLSTDKYIVAPDKLV